MELECLPHEAAPPAEYPNAVGEEDPQRPDSEAARLVEPDSEHQLQAQLIDAGRTRRRHDAEVGRGEVRRHIRELRMVERVERLQPELQPDSVRDREVLEQREIQVVHAGPAFGVPSEIAERARPPAARRPRC